MNKKFVVAVVNLCLMFALIACTGPSPTPTPTPTPAPAPAPTSAPKPTPTSTQPIELKWSFYLSPTYVYTQQVFNPFAAEIERKSEGRVKITMYPSGTLGSAADSYDIVRKGTADIAYVVPALTPGRFPLAGLLELPLLVPNAASATEAAWRLYKEGYFARELGEVEVLAVAMASPQQIISNKPLATLADLKGLKIRVVGPAPGEALSAVGATPVSMAGSEVYLALERGTLDAAAMAITGIVSNKLYESGKYFFEVSLTPTMQYIVMNKDSWAKLPEDIQDIFNSGPKEQVVRWFMLADTNAELLGKATLAKERVQISSVSPADKAKWLGLAKPVWDKYVEEAEKKGLPSRATFDAYLDTLVKLGVR